MLKQFVSMNYVFCWSFLLVLVLVNIFQWSIIADAMKTDEIIMTIVIAKLLGLFKNDQHIKPKPPMAIGYPIGIPLPQPHPIYSDCSRPKKCNRYLSHLKSLDPYEDIYEDVHLPSNIVDDNGYNYNFKDDEYLSSGGGKSKQLFSADVNYVNHPPSSLTYFSTDDNYQGSLKTITSENEDMADNDKVYEKELVYVDAEPNENNESEQILPSNKNEYIDSSANILSNSIIKKLRNNYENSRINSAKQSTKSKLRKLRNKGRKKRKQKYKNDVEIKNEYQIGDEALASIKEANNMDEHQIIQLGEKPSDKFQTEQHQQDDGDEEGEESEREETRYNKNETILMKNITADAEVINGQMKKVNKTNVSESFYSTNMNTNNANINNNSDNIAVTSQSISKNNYSNDQELRLESKISEIIPRTVQRYLGKIKSWNNKRGNRQNSNPFRSKLKYHQQENNKTAQADGH